jgi:gamma-glutamyltranspeptidase/glutathione hydrolase
VLAAGGNAADAAVATAAMLGVVDPQNCGVGGYGGFAVVDDGAGPPRQIGFNTVPPRAFDPANTNASRPGSLVTPPAVVAGLTRLHASCGRLPWSACWAAAIAAAREGIAVGRDLATALRWAGERHPGLNAPFRDVFLRNGEAPREGDRLVQRDLARTLEAIASEGPEAFRRGDLQDRAIASVRNAGGVLDASDFASLDATIGPAARMEFSGAGVYTPDPEQSGASILLEALADLDLAALGPARSERYIRRIGTALAHAWQRRDAAYTLLTPPAGQTTHLACADRDGLLVALTFTHGPTWFGSGLVAEGTGVVLNSGARLLVRRQRDGRCLAQTNLTPTILRVGSNRFALGTPGARRIPAVVLQLVLDLVHYGTALDEALAAPRLSAAADGTLDAETPLLSAFPGIPMRKVEARDYYGPAAALRWRDGVAEGATDPRFAGTCAAHEPL